MTDRTFAFSAHDTPKQKKYQRLPWKQNEWNEFKVHLSIP